MPLTGSYLCNLIAFSCITPAPKGFWYVFVMQDWMNLDAVWCLARGLPMYVYIDNVSLKRNLR